MPAAGPAPAGRPRHCGAILVAGPRAPAGGGEVARWGGDVEAGAAAPLQQQPEAGTTDRRARVME